MPWITWFTVMAVTWTASSIAMIGVMKLLKKHRDFYDAAMEVLAVKDDASPRTRLLVENAVVLLGPLSLALTVFVVALGIVVAIKELALDWAEDLLVRAKKLGELRCRCH